MDELVESVDKMIGELEQRRLLYLRLLDDAISKYNETKNRDAYDEAIGTLAAGVKLNCSLVCRPIVSEGWIRCDREFFQNDSNQKYVAAYSNYKSGSSLLTVNQSLQGLIRFIDSDPECMGLTINPGQENMFLVQRELLLDIMDAWETQTRQNAEDPSEFEDTDKVIQTIISPPIDLEEYKGIEKDIRRLSGTVGDSLDILVDMEHDLPYSIHLTGGDKIHMEILSFSLPVFSNDGHVRTFRLYKDLGVEDVVEAVKRICLYAEPSDLNEYINLSFCGGFLDYDEGKDFMSLWRGIKEFEATLGSSKLKPEEE